MVPVTRSSGGSPRRLLAAVVPIAVTAILSGCGGETLELAGTVERKALELSAPVSAEIVEIPSEVGERVAAGAVVVQLDTEVAQAELRAHQAARAAADAALKEAEGEYQRAVDLRKARVSAVQELDSATRRRDEALALVAEKEARIAQAEKRLDELTLRAPLAGVVDQIAFEEGERVPAGGVAAVVLADEKPWVRVWLPARAVARTKAGSAARIEVEGLDGHLPGRVLDIAREPEFTPHYALTERESAHLVYETRVVIDEAPEGLRPGLPARVRLRLERGGP
ncbi:MAG: efflux RND transporter periplasmic adaptor subunit [Acidobacteriota bacterium]|jgi:HlyD family secretion protein